MPNSTSALATDDSTRYLKAPSLAAERPCPCTISAKAGSDSSSMPRNRVAKPALATISMPPSVDAVTSSQNL